MKKYKVTTKYNNVYIFYAEKKTGNKYCTTFHNVYLSNDQEKPDYIKYTFYKNSLLFDSSASITPYKIEEL